MASSDSGPLTANRDASKEAPETSSSSRYRFRADLEIVRDGDGDLAGSDVTVIDPRSGERHILTADEFHLCRAADGTNTLAGIRQAFNAETGREISLGKLFTFFRRLRSLGLLEENTPDKPESAVGLAEDFRPVNEPRAGATASRPTTEDESVDESLTIVAPGRVVRAAHAAGQSATNIRATRTADVTPLTQRSTEDDGASAPPSEPAPEDPSDSGSAGFGDNKRRVRRRRLMQPRWRTDQPTSLQGSAKADAGSNSDDAGDADGPVDPDRPGDFATAFGGGMGTAGFRLGGGREGRSGPVQNFLAGLAARARAAQDNADADATADRKQPARLALFNPNAILGLLAALTWPLKYIFVPLLLVVPATLWLAYRHREILAQDITGFDVSVVGPVILGLVVANIVCRLTQATFIRGFGAEVEQFGLALTIGVPRFFVDLGGIAALGRRGQLWVHAAPLIARLGLFCAGTLLWFALRQSAPWLSHFALIVGQIGLLAFLLSALPLLPSDGYRWLATYFGRPTLGSDALGSMTGGLLGAPDSAAATGGWSAAIFYGAAIVLALSALALVAQVYFDIAKAGEVRPLTAALLLGLGIALAGWTVALWNYGRGREIEVLDSGATRQVLATWTGQADVASERPVSVGTVGKVFWAVVLCALVAVAFLPYRYDASGTFEILPGQRTKVTVRTSGIVEQVLVREGDWVKANQVLAKLSSDDQQREITITSAELQHAKAQLAQFGGDATGDTTLEQSIADALGDGTDSASAKKDPTATTYIRTQAERAARAEVERLTHKLAYERDQLAQTQVRAPKEGRVMTPNVHLLTGTWLRQGSELMSLADTRTLEAEINLPEADIGTVKVGDKVRLRPWSSDDREIDGTVTDIAPAAQPKPYGMIVRVGASIPDPEAYLRPAMTGYAKIDGENMRVWEAFLGRIIRIVRVEMWSWIP